jgi:dTDP-4-amino-4,6-dideoxygalactose transaminase
MLAGAETPVAVDWAARELSLPMFAEITELEVHSVIGAVQDLTSGLRSGSDSLSSRTARMA